MKESGEIEEIRAFLLYLYLQHGQQALPDCMPITVWRPGHVRYTTPLPHLPHPVFML